VKYDDIASKAPEYGLDVREAIEKFAGFRRGESDSCRRCCRSGIGDGARHILLECRGWRGGRAGCVPPASPAISKRDLSIIAMLDLVLGMAPRMAVTQRAAFYLHRQKELRNALQNIPTLRKRPEDSRGDVTAGFDSRWEPIGIHFPKLRLSPVVLPELFPGSSSVECDF
jgi:hypothetical protein